MKIFKEFLMKEAEAVMGNRDIIIMNIQPAYENRIKFKMAEFINWIKSATNNKFKTTYFFYNGEKTEDNILAITKWYEEQGMIEGIPVEPYNIAQIHEYFDNLLKTNYNHEEFITVIKFLMSKNYDEVRDSNPDELQTLMISDEFKQELIQGKHKIFVPYDLLDKLKKINDPFICGGLKHSSVEIIRILLEVIGKKYSISDKWAF